ncbi:Aste57867_21716 [Aphanomyces stellatus]|uniref:Aste57867_21716 protein n=1 Tax=Aphanomyces stellatus TaxID=120398 RepID=A0A485LIX2_9STRA|nr:hypothetical protein As57867_021647 [Aphanomyces stellatus]VFT98385.1 Aste57867_21716 [Aphanomyces stellatus]
MNFGSDMSVHMLAVHAPASAKSLQRQTSGEYKAHRPRTATSDSNSSAGTKTSISSPVEMYEYKPAFTFHLGHMVRSLRDDVERPTSMQPSSTRSTSSVSSMGSRTNSQHSMDGGSQRSSGQRSKSSQDKAKKPVKKFADMMRVDMAFRM